MRYKIRTKQIVFGLGCILALIGVSRFCHHQTKGFRVSKITDNLLPDFPSSEKTECVDALIQQKFHYLGRGLQSFVFASEDGQYVLKLFNNRYQKKIRLFSILSHFPIVGTWAKQRTAYFEGKLEKTFKSYQIAYHEMQDRTGLIYTHLSPTSHLAPSLTIVDCLNISHTIDPNRTGFLIQKKATLVYPALKDYCARQDIDGAKQALSSLIELFFWKGQHSIADNDPLIRTNYGFIDGKAVQIDVGPLSKQETPPAILQQRQEILRITSSLKNWLNENAPELLPILDRELQQHLSSEQ